MTRDLPNGTEEDLPALGQNATQGQLGEALVEAAMLKLDQLYERRVGLDYGVDGVIELTTGNTAKRATGRQIGVQVKRGISIAKRTRYGFTHYCTDAHANYWLRHSLPIIVVHSDPLTDRLRWQHVSTETLRRTTEGYAIDLPLESDLSASLGALQSLADGRTISAVTKDHTLLLPCSMDHGVLIPDPELGLAALEFSRAALRGESGRLIVEVDEEADLVASIDAISDLEAPTAEHRRDAIIRRDILYRFRQRAEELQRAITLLLTEPMIAASFGYDDTVLAEAIRRLAEPKRRLGEPDTIALDAWPAHDTSEPVIRFDVPKEVLEEFYAKSDLNRVIIRMGAAGGAVVGDLGPNIAATRFLPALTQRLTQIMDASAISPDEAFVKIGVPPSLWLMGLA